MIQYFQNKTFFLFLTVVLLTAVLFSGQGDAQETAGPILELPASAASKNANKTVRLEWAPNNAENESEPVIGKLLADYRIQGQGMIVLEDRMGRIRIIPEKEAAQLEILNEKFDPFNKKQIADELKKEFGKEFDTLPTEHFIIVYHTSNSYAVWCGRLFESIYAAFEKYQARKGFGLKHPDVPMIAVILRDKTEFEEYAAQDAPGVKNIVAYYHRLNNRIVLYDLSGTESSLEAKKRSMRSIDAILSRPQAAYTVATIIHEATHQISFNRKMFLRTGPFPLWLSEGLSMFFETPDANSKRGWSSRGIERPNDYRLKIFNNYIASNPEKPFQSIIQQEYFTTNTNNSYAASWALFYYLNAKESKKLIKYIEYLQQKIPFTVYSPEERLADFEKFFGNDWQKLYKNFALFYNNIH